MTFSLENYHNLLAAYNNICKSLSKELNIPQTALDILLFLANNPQYTTASDIVEIRCIKANLVSINVDKLVKEGYLDRLPISEDRRKTKLVYTNKALPVIKQGRNMQNTFFNSLFTNIPVKKREVFFEVMEMMKDNLTTCTKELD